MNMAMELGFKVARRGYDPGQVNAYIRSQSEGQPADPPSFDLVRRGYDRAQVDAYIKGLRR